jgi:hypothetical protein
MHLESRNTLCDVPLQHCPLLPHSFDEQHTFCVCGSLPHTACVLARDFESSATATAWGKKTGIVCCRNQIMFLYNEWQYNLNYDTNGII